MKVLLSHLDTYSLRHFGWGLLIKFGIIKPVTFALQISVTVIVGVAKLMGFCLEAGRDRGKGGRVVTTPRVKRVR
jgi:hypothetical protein